jgi:hypothetical protein
MFHRHANVPAVEHSVKVNVPLGSAAAVDPSPAPVQFRQVKPPSIQHGLAGVAFVVVRDVTVIGIVTEKRAQAIPGRPGHSRGDSHASRVAT